eukprot:scaffold130967_cov54-Phaeocystis_antarctica.AAC.1
MSLACGGRAAAHDTPTRDERRIHSHRGCAAAPVYTEATRKRCNAKFTEDAFTLHSVPRCVDCGLRR